MNRRLCAAALIVVSLGLASRVYRQYVEARDVRRYPPPGDMVDIGGRRLHLCRVGEGTPSVIMVPCMGGPGSEWWDVQRRLAQYTSVYTYDRAGLGWSDPGPWPRTFAVMADELHDLLTAAKIPSPYLVVGHSTGGIIARQYAVRHPEGLAGLVLVDSSHEDQNYRLAPFRDYRPYYLRMVLRKLLQPLGLIRLAQDLSLRKSPTGQITPVNQAAKCERADVQEIIGHIFRGAGAAPPNLGDLPLLVINADADHRQDAYKAEWSAMQAELAGLSTRSRHVVMEGVGHHINRDDPDALVARIRDAITWVAGEPLE